MKQKNQKLSVEDWRRLAVPLIAFSIGMLLNGGWPDWARVVIPVLWLLWLMAYDEASYRLYEKNAK